MARVYQVAIKKAFGFSLVSRKDFLSLPATSKKQLIANKKVEFVDEFGALIPFIEGVTSILEK